MIRQSLGKITHLFRKSISAFKSQTVFKKILIVAGTFGAVVFGACLFLFLLVWSGALGRLPNREEISQVENPAATEVYSADSVLIGRYFIQERSNIEYNDIPKPVEHALLATEDVRFYKHHGIDIISLFRVLIKSILLQQESSGGGSTITQQLAKNLYPRKQYKYFSMPINKIREMIIAWRFESIYDKKSILSLYLNTIPFADNTYGIDAAAQRFFSVPTKSLSLEQGAVLVGMLKATYSYNPRIFPDRSKQRRNVVIAQMAKYNLLEDAQAKKLQSTPLKLKYNNNVTHYEGLAPYFRQYLRRELLAWCEENKKKSGEPYNLYTDGLKVYTTLNSRLQRHAEDAVTSQMAIIQKKFDQHWGKREPWYKQPRVVTDALKRSDRYKKLAEQGLSEKAILKVMSKPTVMSVFTYKGEKEIKMSPLDSIKHYLKFLNAGFLAMDSSQGAIKVWVGGINHNYFQYDHVKASTKRQVGSTFKPIVYAAAIERGIKPCDFISAEKTTYTNIEDMDEWSPQNTDDNYDLKFSLEGALAYSVNTVSVKVLEKAGIGNTIALAKEMGIRSTIPQVPSLALGVADISMIEMVTAYSCMANKGNVVEPYYITSILDSRGNVIHRHKPKKSRRALSETTAQIMVHMLKRTVNEGTAGRLRWEYGIKNDIAGKTGTTQSNADGWFMAMTPKLVIGSWVGADDPRIRFRATSLGQGSSTALPIVAKFLQKVNSDSKFDDIAEAKFSKLPSTLASRLSCPVYKSDLTFWESLFGKPDEAKEIKRDFGGTKKKQNVFKKLFGKAN